MTTAEFLRLAINLHCRTVVGLLDAADRADTPEQKRERLAMARDAVIEFKRDFSEATKEIV